MKIRTLELRNYRRHARTHIEWPDGVVAVLGRNGSGKSSLLEAIGFALYGVPATRTGKDLIRWDGAGPMDPVSVALEFELGPEAIRIHRELRGKGLTPNATMTVDGRLAVDPGAGSNDAVTQEVERRLGMDRDTFFTTVVAKQGDLDRLAGMAPAKRKQLILEMLGVDALDRAIEAARAHRKSIEDKVEALRSALPDDEVLQARQDAADQAVAQAEGDAKAAAEAWGLAKQALASAAQTLERVERDAALHAARVEALASARRVQEQAAKDLEAASARRRDAEGARQKVESLAGTAEMLAPLQARLDAARQAASVRLAAEAARTRVAAQERVLADLDGQDPRPVDAVQEDLERNRAVHRAALEQAAMARAHAATADEHVAHLAALGEDAPCPTCERPLADHLPSLRARWTGERTQAQDALRTAEAVVAAADGERAALAAEEARARARADAAARLEELRAAVPVVPHEAEDPAVLEPQVAAARAAQDERLHWAALAKDLAVLVAAHDAALERHADAQVARADAEQALQGVPDPGADLAAARKARDEAAAAERGAERTTHEVEVRRAVARKDAEAVKARRDESRQQRKRLTEVEDEAQYWAALAGGRGRGLLEAFKAHLVARIGPSIGREASRLLTRFTGGRYTEVTLDSEYNLYVSDGGVRYTLDRFSGGESDLVHLALRLAVSRLLVERSEADLRFLALDEVFGSLDSERRGLVLAALQELGSLYAQVVLVTHHDDLRDALDGALVVEERGGEAHVTLHGG